MHTLISSLVVIIIDTITEFVDYEPITQRLTDFPTSIDIVIINDTMLNPIVHTFFVVLRTNDSQVELDPSEVHIDIIDDEGMSTVVYCVYNYYAMCVAFDCCAINHS